MRRSLLFLALLLLAGNAYGNEIIGLKISDLGINGTYRQRLPFARLQIEAQNNSGEKQSFSLRVFQTVAAAAPVAHSYLIPLTLRPAEKRVIDVPLQLASGLSDSVLYAEAVTEKGTPLGHAGRKIGRPTDGKLIGLLCGSEEICKTIQKTILFSGTPEEQTRKSQDLRILQLKELPRVWWAYLAMNDIVLAAPTNKLSQEQVDALEAFTLRGGTLVLSEKEMGDTAMSGAPFWANHSKPANGEPAAVGHGTLVRVTSVSSAEFGGYFRPYGFSISTPQEIQRGFQRFRNPTFMLPQGNLAGYLFESVVTRFKFPGILELVLWMTAYLVLMVVLNFLLLRRMGKPGLGWITIPLLAIVFSFALYIVSARNRPTEYGLDEARYYQLDGSSTMAVAESRIQITAPHKGIVQMAVPREFAYLPPEGDRIDSLESPGSEGSKSPTEIKLDEAWESSVFLRVWSSVALTFEFTHRFPGSIAESEGNRLSNGSGVDFEEAVLVTHGAVYLLGRLPTGGVADLNTAKKIPYSEFTGYSTDSLNVNSGPPFGLGPEKPGREDGMSHPKGVWTRAMGSPVSMEDAVRGWPIDADRVFAQTKAVFLGRGKDLMPAGTLRGISTQNHSIATYVVTYREWK